MPSQRDVDEHMAVVEAIERGDGDGARRAMRAHLDVEVAARGGDGQLRGRRRSR
jgi:DNA-binding GntR family transcriptional regulator